MTRTRIHLEFTLAEDNPMTSRQMCASVLATMCRPQFWAWACPDFCLGREKQSGRPRGITGPAAEARAARVVGMSQRVLSVAFRCKEYPENAREFRKKDGVEAMRDEAGRREGRRNGERRWRQEPSPDLRSSTGPVRPLTTTSSTAFVWWIVHARSEHSLIRFQLIWGRLHS